MVSCQTRSLGLHASGQTDPREAEGQRAGLGRLCDEGACWPSASLSIAPGRRRWVWAAWGLLLTGLMAAVLPSPLKAQVPSAKKSRVQGAAKARMLSALAGLILLGLGMMALVWLGARITQRYRHSTPFFRPTPRPGEHDWARKPLVPPPELPGGGRDGRSSAGPAENA